MISADNQYRKQPFASFTTFSGMSFTSISWINDIAQLSWLNLEKWVCILLSQSQDVAVKDHT